MCGRFVSSSTPDQVAAYFGVDQVGETLLEPSYNVAPTNDVYVVLESGGVRRLEAFHWGLVPFWAKDPKIGNRMINARAETVADKNAFRTAFRKRRCLIPADGFYEWTKKPGQEKKQPMYIHRPDGEPFAFAGLWETWRGDDGVPLQSCTIITGQPNEAMAEIHDRMPAILPPSAWSTWLDTELVDPDVLRPLLVPAPNRLITMHPVSTEVNNPRNGGEHLIERAEDDPPPATGRADDG